MVTFSLLLCLLGLTQSLFNPRMTRRSSKLIRIKSVVNDSPFITPCLPSPSSRATQVRPHHFAARVSDDRGFHPDEEEDDYQPHGRTMISDEKEEGDSDDAMEYGDLSLDDLPPSEINSLGELERYADGADVQEQHDQDITDEHHSMLAFVSMLEESLPGSLQGEEITLLRELISSGCDQLTRVENDETTKPSSSSSGEIEAQLFDRLLIRLVVEWEAVSSKEPQPSSSPRLLEPTNDDFLLALQGWEKALGLDPLRVKTSTLPLAVERVCALLDRQEELYATHGRPEALKPSADTFRTVLRVLSFSRERGADRRAVQILELMQDLYDLSPDASMFQSVIFSLAKSKGQGAAHRAEDMLREAVERFPPKFDRKHSAMPTGITVDSFNVVLTAWAKSGLPYGPERAEKLIYFMDELDARHGNHGLVKPTITSFTSLLDAYAQGGDWESASQCERVLNRLLDTYLEGEAPLEPNVASWTIVIGAWARLSKKYFKGAASRAERLLRRMETLHREGRIHHAPDAKSYVTCMNAFAFSKAADGPEKVEEILNEMNERYLDGEDDMQPSTRAIRMLIDSWIRSSSPEAMERAERVLDVYEDLLHSSSKAVKADDENNDLRNIYKSMLFGWSKKGDPIRAQGYLLDMVEGGMKPDCFCYDKVIEANAMAGDSDFVKRIYEVFDLMEDCRQSGDVKPNERLYTSFIRALTKARVPGLAQKSYAILKRMDALFEEGNKGIKPTVYTYNAVLMACSETPYTENPEPLEAFKIALRVFNTLRSKREEPDHVTFGNMLRCSNLLPEGEQKEYLVRSTFNLCCKSGFVNTFVLRDLQAAALEDVWRELLNCPEGDVDVDLLPEAWKSRFMSKRPSSPERRTPIPSRKPRRR